MQAKEVEIVKILRSGAEGRRGETKSYVSGQALSRELGISRTAVWKHIRNLRKMGFQIEASPSKGYSLRAAEASGFNGIGIQAALATGIIGKKVFFYPSIDSTNTKAFELARNGEPEGTVVIADAQLKGKGRIGRRWESPPGVNVYTSVILRPDVPPQYAQNLTFLSAVAVAEAVEAVSHRRPAVKWPNDILIDSRKVAGILMEMDSEADRINFVIAGIGVNVNMEESMLPDSIKTIAASLAEKSGGEVDRIGFVRSLYSSIEKWYKIYLREGFTPILSAWKSYFDAEGKPTKVNCFNSSVSGICAGVDESGALLVRNSAGAIVRIISGDAERG